MTGTAHLALSTVLDCGWPCRVSAWATLPCTAGDPEVAKDNEVLESIMTIVSDRAAVSKPAAGGGGASEAAASFLSGLGGGADDHASARGSRDRDRY